MQHSIQLKKKTSFFAAFLLELKKLLGVRNVRKQSSVKWPVALMELVRPRIVPRRRKKIRDKYKFIPMSYYHRQNLYGRLHLVCRITQFVEKNPVHFSNPSPSVADVWQAYHDVIGANIDYQSAGSSRLSYRILVEKEKKLQELFQKLIQYVETIALDQSDYFRTALIGDK